MGAGESVLMLHGYLSNKESFYFQTEFLARSGYRAVAPDMPAFGQSSPIDTAWSVGDYARWLKSFIKVRELYGCCAVAHSFGARVIFKLLAEEQGLIKKLVITGGAGLVKPRSSAYMRRVKRYRRIKKLFPGYAEKHFGSEEYRSLSPLMRESYKLIVNEDLRGCAEKLRVPTLLVYGSGDTVTPPFEEGEIFHTLIKNSRLEIIDGGHFCFSDNSEKFNALLLEFLNNGN